MQPSIEILVATYNGELFLAPLLESLLGQSLSVDILIRDDHSTDRTQTLIDAYVSAHPDQVRQIPHDGSPAGASRNFSKLLSGATAAYVLLADQDDIWDTDKTAICLAEMQRIEELVGKTSPVLVHSDLRVVDQELKQIAPSFFDFQGLNKQRLGLRDMLAQNIVTGCTTMLNRALYLLASPVPDEAVMHDWWIALVAAGRGHIGFVDRPTLSYRQHDHNTLGAQSNGLAMVNRYLTQVLSRKGCAALVSPLSIQAEELLHRHGDHLKSIDRLAVEATANLRKQDSCRRLWSANHHGIQKHGRFKQAVFLWALLNAIF